MPVARNLQTLKFVLDKAVVLADERRDDVERYLDRAQEFVDRRTDSRYADRVTQVRAQVSKGVDKLAQQRRR